MTVQRIARLADLQLTDDAVVVADGGLPPALLEGLPEPLLVEAGEGLKTLGAMEHLAARVLARRSSRPLTLVAVGGGLGVHAAVLHLQAPLRLDDVAQDAAGGAAGADAVVARL